MPQTHTAQKDNGAAIREGAILDVRNLKTYFFLKEGVVRAVDGVDFYLDRGEVLGIVGESGCGKSVATRSVLRIIQPPGSVVEGNILFEQRNGTVIDMATLPQQGDELRSIRGRDINMIFQEPMTAFSPVHTIGNQVAESLLLHEEISKPDARDAVIDMFRTVGIPRPENVFTDYPHQLSGGMRQRAMIAMALMCKPRILIADEPTTAIDVTLQAQILRLLRELQETMDLSVIFITHDLGVIAQVAARVGVMYLGKMVESGTVEQIFDEPLHPYTRDLLKSIPRLEIEGASELSTIKGTVPDPYSIPQGCFFHPRCSSCIEGVCDSGAFPQAREVTEGHVVRCHLFSRDEAGAT